MSTLHLCVTACIGGLILFPMFFYHPVYYNEAVVKGSLPDTATWDTLMTKYVSQGALEEIDLNVVDYAGLAKDPDFDAYLKSLATADLANMDRALFYTTFMNA